MAKREWKKPRLSVQVEKADESAMNYVASQLPALEGRQGKSLVLRAALRIGLRRLMDEPELVMTTPPLSPDEPKRRRTS